MAISSLAGIGISAYLTAVHYANVPLVCTTSGAINCERVLSSPYSVIVGSSIPTSAAGLVWFAASAALAAATWAGRGSPLMARLQLAWSGLGFLTVIGLLFIEIVVLGTICLWCTAAHALVVAIFLMVLWGARGRVEA